MTEATVSVLIPCYNAEKYIADTLESVFRQTWPHIQVVVVDDGSTDNSLQVVTRLRRGDFTIVRQRNLGQTAALNVCLANCRGQFVQYLDADDILASDKIERQLCRLVEDPNCIASGEWARFYGEPEQGRFDPESVWRDLDPVDWLALSRADGLGMMLPAMWLLPVQIVRAIGPWNEALSLNNDAEYFTRAVLAAERVLFCPGARCYYRSGLANSLSGSKSKAAWASQSQVTSLCEDYIRAREDSERVRRAFALSWQHLAHGCYPYDRDLAERALARAQALHPVTIRPQGGRAFHIASRLLGWRTARKLQRVSGRP